MMTRMIPVLLATGLVVAGFGCQTEARTDVSAAPSGAAQAVAADEFIVTLKVPNMVWQVCAASVRGALKEVKSFADIKTDVPGRSCSFKVTKTDFDFMAKLTELAKKNEHLKDFTIKKK